MGFSLKRALAGAVVGGAHAAGEIADATLKEAARQRELEEQYRRQREIIEMQDENYARRQQRVADIKEAKDIAKQTRVKEFMSTTLSALRGAGIDSGSAEGQRKLAEAAAEAGHQDYADKFYDNATRMMQISSNEDLKREEIKARVETARLARAARESSRNDSNKEDERGFTFAGMAGGRIMIPSRDGKPVKFDNGPGYMQQLYGEARENGLDPKEARRLVNDTQVAISKGLKVNADDPDDIAARALTVARRVWEPAQEKAPAPTESKGLLQKPAAARNYTPSIFGSQSQSSGANSDLVSKIPY